MGARPELCLVDAGVLVAAFDRREGDRHELAMALVERLWQEQRGAVSVTVLEEFYQTLTRSGGLGMSAQVARRLLQAFSFWTVYTPKANDLLLASEYQKKYQFSFYDGLVLQAALACKCRRIYSEGLWQGRRVDEIEVVNPFVGEETLK